MCSKKVMDIVKNDKKLFEKLNGFTLLSDDLFNTFNDLQSIKLGGIIRYIDDNNKYYGGGILIKIIGTCFSDCYFMIKSIRIFKIKYSNYYIFYKPKLSMSESLIYSLQ